MSAELQRADSLAREAREVCARVRERNRALRTLMGLRDLPDHLTSRPSPPKAEREKRFQGWRWSTTSGRRHEA